MVRLRSPRVLAGGWRLAQKEDRGRGFCSPAVGGCAKTVTAAAFGVRCNYADAKKRR
jgi:hypothetical protein